MTMQKSNTGKPRGFAAMDRSKVSEIAQKGGKAAHAANTAHKWTAEEAKAAGAKGGKAVHAKRAAAKAIIATNAQPQTKTHKGAKAKGTHAEQVGCESASGCAGTIQVPNDPTSAAEPAEQPELTGQGDLAAACGSGKAGCGSDGPAPTKEDKKEKSAKKSDGDSGGGCGVGTCGS